MLFHSVFQLFFLFYVFPKEHEILGCLFPCFGYSFIPSSFLGLWLTVVFTNVYTCE